MRLIKCYIENFGMFSGYSVDFKDGLNSFYSENSTGKTTLSVFISAMLFGFPETRKQSLDENERKKYSPWQGGTYGGSLTIDIGGTAYTVERTFGTKSADDTYTLRYTKTGTVSSDYGPNIGEELFGIDRDGFLRTVFLSEKNLPVRNENKTISAKLGSLVGVDGDVGGFDEAIRLLDDRRKFYYKKSGSCEINNVKARIVEKNLERDRLIATKEKAEQTAEALRELGERKRRLEEKKAEISERLIRDAKNQEREVHIERYRSLAKKLQEEKKRRYEIEAVLGEEKPTAAMIEEARFSIIEGERIIRECSLDIGDNYGELYEKYSKVDIGVISGAERALEDLKETEAKIRDIEAGVDRSSIRMREMFPSGAPSADEMEIYSDGKKTGGAGKAMVLFGILSTVAGAILGYLVSLPMLALCALGAVLFITGVVMPKNPKIPVSIRRSLEEKLGGGRLPVKNDEIEKLKRDIAIYRELSESRGAELDSLTARREELNTLLNDLSLAIGITPSEDHARNVSLIKEEYTKYYTLTIAHKQYADGKRQRMATAEAMIKKGRDFIERFPLGDDNPFDELSGLVTEYGYLQMSIKSMTDECDSLKVRYGITEEALVGTSFVKDASLEDQLAECEAELGDAVRQYALAGGEYERQLREIEILDSVNTEIESLTITLHEYERSLGIIQSTMSLLSEACENMTARYIGKTRKGFERYENAIGGAGGSYAVATDFSVTKNERGGARSEESYSRGTKDLYSLALRLSLIDALYDTECPFVILDDPFIALDDERIEKGKRLILELSKKHQILYFTCSRSRAI